MDVGYKGIVDRIREVVGDNPVYITFDIDVIDPAFAPAYVCPFSLDSYRLTCFVPIYRTGTSVLLPTTQHILEN